jgi:hypothetical protein
MIRGMKIGSRAATTDYETINIESGQYQPDERSFEAEIPNAEPHGHDHLPISRKAQIFTPVGGSSGV